MSAITRKESRRKNDFYATPSWATEVLINSCPIEGDILECCAGANDITSTLRKHFDRVITNDIDSTRTTDYHFDLSTPIGWLGINEKPTWIITNPPFCHAPGMVPLAYEFASVGIAMLLRLSFLEPCINRSNFLVSHPPTQLIVLPRISFTGDGGTDSITCGWMVWDKRVSHTSIAVVASTN